MGFFVRENGHAEILRHWIVGLFGGVDELSVGIDSVVLNRKHTLNHRRDVR